QAEDGIRVFHVTGVQTCALPILDSVSDEALRCGAELVVHAYPDGRAPGMDRLRRMGLAAHQVASVGTSEDVALLMAYELGASLIVAVGTHSNIVDFFEKEIGRAHV